MKNKNLLIGGAVVLGIIIYLRSRKNTNESRSEDAGGGIGSVGGDAISKENGGGAVMQTSQPEVVAKPKMQKPTTQTTTQLTKFELESRLLKSCGVRPIVKGARRNLYNECVAREKANLRQQGLISFNGMDESNLRSLDFDGNIID